MLNPLHKISMVRGFMPRGDSNRKWIGFPGERHQCPTLQPQSRWGFSRPGQPEIIRVGLEQPSDADSYSFLKQDRNSNKFEHIQLFLTNLLLW